MPQFADTSLTEGYAHDESWTMKDCPVTRNEFHALTFAGDIDIHDWTDILSSWFCVTFSLAEADWTP